MPYSVFVFLPMSKTAGPARLKDHPCLAHGFGNIKTLLAKIAVHAFGERRRGEGGGQYVLGPFFSRDNFSKGPIVVYYKGRNEKNSGVLAESNALEVWI